MNFLKFLGKRKLNFQTNTHNSHFLNFFKKRESAHQSIKSYKNINSYKCLLSYLYDKYPANSIPHYDYPFLFHYNNIFQKTNCSLVVNDFGGSFGPHYNSVSNFIQNSITEWNVYEEDSIITDLKKLNTSQNFKSKINFYNFDGKYRKCNVLYASGSIQYYNFDSPLELLQ